MVSWACYILDTAYYLHSPSDSKEVYVVVVFLSQVIFVFLLFLGNLMYVNEV